jgi:hypothetical protein
MNSLWVGYNGRLDLMDPKTKVLSFPVHCIFRQLFQLLFQTPVKSFDKLEIPVHANLKKLEQHI